MFKQTEEKHKKMLQFEQNLVEVSSMELCQQNWEVTAETVYEEMFVQESEPIHTTNIQFSQRRRNLEKTVMRNESSRESRSLLGNAVA